MINNSDMIKATCSNNYVCKWYLPRNVLCNIYFSKRNMPLAYLFRWRYAEGDRKDIPFRANLDNGG